jgi:serine/threonine-protein phosphatase PGAM5
MKLFWCCKDENDAVVGSNNNATRAQGDNNNDDENADNSEHHDKLMDLVKSKSHQLLHVLQRTGTSSDPHDPKSELLNKVLKDVDPCRRVEERGKAGMLSGTFEDTPTFFGMFPLRQTFVPRIPYPLWDTHWETNGSLRQETIASADRAMSSVRHSVIASAKIIEAASPTARSKKPVEVIMRDNLEEDKHNLRASTMSLSSTHARPQRIVTRHVILIRHGQYDETGVQDNEKVLTALGKRQAKLTGIRLAELVEANDIKGGCCSVRSFSVSQYTRAIQTADIIYQQLVEMYQRNGIPQDQRVPKSPSDPLLNEGVPAHFIPGEEANSTRMGMWTEAIGKDNPRIEKAFKKYIGQSEWLVEEQAQRRQEEASANEVVKSFSSFGTTSGGTVGPANVEHHHEYEIIVSHANLIRYMTCRSLQIPPETWLRFEVFNASLTYLVIKSYGHVVCRMIGDVGHFPYDACSVDMTDGFAWEDSDAPVDLGGQSAVRGIVQQQIKSLSHRLVPQFMKTTWN